MDETSATTGNMKPISLATLTRAIQEINLLPKPDQWIVIGPQGQMYKGTVEQMTGLLVREHPLLKIPTHLEVLARRPDV